MSVNEYSIPEGLDYARRVIPVLVPWRPDGGARDENWQRVHAASWLDWLRLFPGESPEGPFNRSAALNDAYRKAIRGDQSGPRPDVVIVADADSMVDEHQLARAIMAARLTGRLTIAHDRWLNVEHHERDAFLGGEPLNETRVRPRRGAPKYMRPRKVYRQSVSSMLVIPTALWDKVGGFDERFVGWGYEDLAFHRMCKYAMGGVERIPGPVWHLEHERPAGDTLRRRDPNYAANRELWRRYRAAGTYAELEKVRTR